MHKKIRKFFKPKKLTSLRTEEKNLLPSIRSLSQRKKFFVAQSRSFHSKESVSGEEVDT